jgi:hypothetical protein
MNGAGVLVATCRGFIRDLLTEFAWWIVKKGTIALAAAPYTGGGSLAALLTDTGIYAAKLAKNFADKLSKLARDLGGLFKKMRVLADFLGASTRRGLGVSLAKSYIPSLMKGADDQVSLSAADAAEQQVAEQEPINRKADTEPPRLETPVPPVMKKHQGPGLGARWTASGTLDE